VNLAEEPDALRTLAVVAQSNWQRFGTKWWPRFREAYMNMLLARPITQVRNALGNTVAAGNAILERQAGALFTLDKKNGARFTRKLVSYEGDGTFHW